jgi:lipid-A-disaccharide synthase
MKIFVSAAEISSDLQAEKVVRALMSLYPEGSLQFYGIAGPRLRAIPGFQVIEKAENLRVMGFTEVLGKLSFIKKTKEKALAVLKENPPEVIMTFDYPDFHFSLLKDIQKIPQLSSTLKISGIPPKVWVWRKGRVEKIRELYDGVWVIFPFEKEFYESHGIPVIYEGNPLIADLFQKEIHKQALMTAEGIRLAVMPGSREAELKYHLPLIPGALEALSSLTHQRVIAEVPIPTGVGAELIKKELISNEKVRYEFFDDGSREVLARNRVGLIKSGTSTLEAAVLGCVPVIFYKVSPVSELIFKLIVRYAGPVGLPNILLGAKRRKDSTYKEFIGIDAKVMGIAHELFRLCESEAELNRLQNAGESLKRELVPNADVPLAVAKKIQSWIQNPPFKSRKKESHLLLGVGSFIWSTINGARRVLQGVGVIRSETISIPSVLVGNLQAGGAGKTPFVIALAREAQKRSYRVGVVSRGFGARYSGKFHLANAEESAELIGDEPKEILRAVPGVKVCLSKDRVLASQKLLEQGVDFLIFDDGFQNLKFTAKITVLLVTDRARDEVIYRDFDAATNGADFLFQMKGKATPRFLEAIPLRWSVAELPQQPVWILCGVADPLEVESFYREQGVKVTRMITLPDHAQMDHEWVKKLMTQADAEGAILAVTEKDWVKLDGSQAPKVFVLRRTISNSDALAPIFERLQ